MTPSNESQPEVPGRGARRPDQIPIGGWWQIARRAFREASEDNIPMLAAGVAFYAFLSLFPTLIAAVTTYGLLSDPVEVTEQIGQLSALLPASARPLIAEQLSSVAAGSTRAWGWDWRLRCWPRCGAPPAA